MNYTNTINQLEYVEEVNQWITTTLNMKNNQSRFTKYKKYLNEKYIKENFESYNNLLKLYTEYISFKNDYIKVIDINNSIEYELSEQLTEVMDSLKNLLNISHKITIFLKCRIIYLFLMLINIYIMGI